MNTRVKSCMYTPDIEVDGTPDIPYGKGRKMVPQVVTVGYLRVAEGFWFAMWVEVAGKRRDLAKGTLTSESHTASYAGERSDCPAWVWQIVEKYRPVVEESND
jgi:hypothetical protein